MEPDQKIGLESPERRRFIAKSGALAAATPAAVSFLLSTSLASEAVAQSANGNAGNSGKDKKEKFKEVVTYVKDKRPVRTWVNQNRPVRNFFRNLFG